MRWNKERWRDWLNMNSLRAQLLTRTLLIVAVLLVLIGILQYVFMKDFVYRNRAEVMEAQLRSMPVDLLTREAKTSGREGTPPQGPLDRYLFFSDMTLAIIQKDGTLRDISREDGLSAPRLSEDIYAKLRANAESRRRMSDFYLVEDRQGNEQLVVVRAPGPKGSSGELLQMGTSTAPLKALLLRQQMTFLSLSLLGLAIGVVLMLPILRRTLIPLSQMVQTVGRIDAGNLTERVATNQGQQEIDRLAISFNGMLERLEASFATEKEAQLQMRRFVADASHELRTPLTSIHGFLEVLLRGAAANPQQLQVALESMYGESKRIKKLVEDLLLLAKMDRAPEMVLNPALLDDLLISMKPQLQMLAGERKVVYDITAEVHARIDVDAMKQVVLNLFSNAVQHTDMSLGVIKVGLSVEQGMAVLDVGDNGPGMEKKHLDRIFERFYRGDTSRTRRSGGAGLGLSITESIVHAHQGHIGVKSEPGKGSVFTVRLPLI